jgi:predicted GIY-YIG superfamily endonuclease
LLGEHLPYHFYILYSESFNRYYSGSSENPMRRLTFHNSIEKGFTARFRPWKLVFTQEVPTKQAAQQAGRKVKSWKSKIMIERLLRGEISP